MPIPRGKSGRSAPAQLGARSHLPRGRLGHNRQHFPVPLRPAGSRAPTVPLASRARQCACASREGQAREPNAGSRHSDRPRHLGDHRLSSLAKQGPSLAVPLRWATASRSPGSSPGSRDFRSRAGRKQAEKSCSGASGMDRGNPKDPHDVTGLLRRCDGCVSRKAVPAGISRYRQPVCLGAAHSARDFPAQSRTL